MYICLKSVSVENVQITGAKADLIYFSVPKGILCLFCFLYDGLSKLLLSRHLHVVQFIDIEFRTLNKCIYIYIGPILNYKTRTEANNFLVGLIALLERIYSN